MLYFPETDQLKLGLSIRKCFLVHSVLVSVAFITCQVSHALALGLITREATIEVGLQPFVLAKTPIDHCRPPGEH